MLDPESTWVEEFSKLSPADTAIQGVMNLADVIEKLTNKVEPNLPTADSVAPGTFKWNKAIFISQLSSLIPTQAPDWVPKMAGAWSAACTAGIITPGTVTASSVWTASVSDINTMPTAAATIPTISAGQAILTSMLSSVPGVMSGDPKEAQKMFAKAFFAAVKVFTFVLIGLVAAPPAPPIPLPITAPAK